MKEAAGRKVAARARLALGPAGLLPMSQRMPVSQRMPASVLPISKREPVI